MAYLMIWDLQSRRAWIQRCFFNSVSDLNTCSPWFWDWRSVCITDCMSTKSCNELILAISRYMYIQYHAWIQYRCTCKFSTLLINSKSPNCPLLSLPPPPPSKEVANTSMPTRFENESTIIGSDKNVQSCEILHSTYTHLQWLQYMYVSI